jgi:hypothetical protein
MKVTEEYTLFTDGSYEKRDINEVKGIFLEDGSIKLLKVESDNDIIIATYDKFGRKLV